MKVDCSPSAIFRPALWCFAVLFAALIVVWPVAGQAAGDAKAAPARSATGKGKTTDKPKAAGKSKTAGKEKTADEEKAPSKEKAASKEKTLGKSRTAGPEKTTGKAKAVDKEKSASEEKPVGKPEKTHKEKAASKDKSSDKETATTEAKTARKSRTAKEKDADPATEASASVGKTRKSSSKARRPVSKARKPSKAASAARTARIRRAFVASSELRPMAQQLATLRTPEAYAGVAAYARRHDGEAAAAAYLALGHAYLADKRYSEAQASLKQARRVGEELADYADFLGAQASHEAGDDAAAEALLHGFTDRYPDSIFDAQAPELEASVLLAMNDAAGAQRVLEQAQGLAAEDRSGFRLAQGQVARALGREQEAVRIFKQLLLSHPLSQEAQIARARLTEMGAELTESELRSLGDAYYNGGHYRDAAEQYHALASVPGLDAGTRNSFAVAEAACKLKLKQLTTAQAEALPDTSDENGARRLYLLMELARNRDSLEDQQHIVAEMQTRFPASPWLAEALFSSGNMYMLKHIYPTAVSYYGYLAAHFPGSKNASVAHWRAGWLSYRQGLLDDAARMFDEQIRLYPTSMEAVAALYWRGRLHETRDQNPAQAAANYRAIVRAYPHFFYAQMARQRLAALGNAQPAEDPRLDRFQALPAPRLVEDFPVGSPHLAKARLLANAGLSDYIAKEISADPDSSSWSALAEAQIYASYGETFRAMRALKRALPSAASAPIKFIPLAYWRILFPEPWWETIKAESAKNNLDPYMVVSLIRQESEFNPSAVSYANAYGLMQLLPPVGKELAREEGDRHFQTFQLLDPETNIRLGTRNLRQLLDHFGGVQEYALAAYNAGNSRVADWQSVGTYSGIDEFVETIPFTQTREYVESIRRNEEIYREIDEYARSHGKEPTAAPR
jgi:soluble lytic murein transglycosylase